jgi:hypothetical protein
MKNIQEQRYIPEGYELSWDDQDLGIQIYYKESPTICGLCFVGRAIKPTWQYRFRNAEQRLAEVTKTFEWVNRRAKHKADKKAELAFIKHDVKVGDVFLSSWGYDQTNIDYYEVISVSGKSATICAIGAISEGNGCALQGVCAPATGKFIGKPFKKLIQYHSATSGPHIKVCSHRHAWRIEPVAVIEGKKIFEQSTWTAYA